MVRGRRSRSRGRVGAWLVAAAAAAVLVGVVAVFVLRDGGGESAYTPVVSFRDVHGLAVDPMNASVVFVATHDGLVRGVDGAWARVGGMRDDLMGFSAHPQESGTFWTSGHPRGGGNMGVRQSMDGGVSWRVLWDEPVDFHAMAVSPADPGVLWGSYGRQLYGSQDAGRSWSVVGPAPPGLRALSAHPAEPGTLFATSQDGIVRSLDAGRSWSALVDLPAYAVAFDPTRPDVVYAGGADALWKSLDGGATWNPLPSPSRGAFAFLAVSASQWGVVYAATYETGVYRSDDGGATWMGIKAPSR